MTYSKDRTMLASFAFADPDKKDRRHYMACKYLAEHEQHKKLLLLLSMKSKRKYAQTGVKLYSHFEKPISKGVGQYKTTIGFVDLTLEQEWYEAGAGSESHVYGDDASTFIRIEVKIAKHDVDDILRQVNLYKEYSNNDYDRWVVATAFELGAQDVDVLKKMDIHNVLLGKGFEEYTKQEQIKSSDSFEF